MKTNKKAIVTTLVLSALMSTGVFGLTTSHAAFKLSEDVKTATPALLTASQIGVKVSENAALAKLPNKDAIVVTSFGTTFKNTRQANIESTVKDIQAAHPNTKVVLAFTSHIIRDRIQEKEGITYPTPEEALDGLQKEGYTRIALTSLNIIPGMEYNYNAAVFHQYKNNFKKMTLGLPLMYWMGQENQRDDINQVFTALKSQFPNTSKTDAVLLMTHGTPDPSNAYYSVMQNRIQSLGLKNVYIYTVEGWPSLEGIIPELKAKGIKHVTLMPVMMVAGDHATNDMSGDEKDSHKSILQEAGFKVDTYVHGLGENPNIRQIFVERADEAWNELQK